MSKPKDVIKVVIEGKNYYRNPNRKERLKIIESEGTQTLNNFKELGEKSKALALKAAAPAAPAPALKPAPVNAVPNRSGFRTIPSALRPAVLAAPAAEAAPIGPDAIVPAEPVGPAALGPVFPIKRRMAYVNRGAPAPAPAPANPIYDKGIEDLTAELPKLRPGQQAEYDYGNYDEDDPPPNNPNAIYQLQGQVYPAPGSQKVIPTNFFKVPPGRGGGKKTRRKNIIKKRSRKIKKGKRVGRKKSRKLKKIITRKKKRVQKVQKVQKGGVATFEDEVKNGLNMIDGYKDIFIKQFKSERSAILLWGYIPFPGFWGFHKDYTDNKAPLYLKNDNIPITFFDTYKNNINTLVQKMKTEFQNNEKTEIIKILKEKLNTPELFDMSEIYTIISLTIQQTWKRRPDILRKHVLKDEYIIDKMNEIQFKDYVNNFIKIIEEYAALYKEAIDYNYNNHAPLVDEETRLKYENTIHWNTRSQSHSIEWDKDPVQHPDSKWKPEYYIKYKRPYQWIMTEALSNYFDDDDYDKKLYKKLSDTNEFKKIKGYNSMQGIYSEKEVKVFKHFTKGVLGLTHERIGEKNRLINLLFGVHQLKRYFVCRLLQELNGWTKKVDEEEETVEKEKIYSNTVVYDTASDDPYDNASLNAYRFSPDEGVDDTPEGFPSGVNKKVNNGYLDVGEEDEEDASPLRFEEDAPPLSSEDDTSPPGSNKGGKRKYNKRYTRRKNRGKPPAKQALRPH